MAVTWDKIFREVALKGNQLAADAPATLQTNYQTADIGQTQLGDRATEFPQDGIEDAILNASEKLVNAIGHSNHNTYRRPFLYLTIDSNDTLSTKDSSTALTSGDRFPIETGTRRHTDATGYSNSNVTISAGDFTRRDVGRKVQMIKGGNSVITTIKSVTDASNAVLCDDYPASEGDVNLLFLPVPIIGVPSRFFDASTDDELENKPIQIIRQTNLLGSTLGSKEQNLYYHFDGERAWHTQSTNKAYAEVVGWDREAQRVAMTDSTSRGVCPFPEGTLNALVAGALGELFRQSFNVEQAQIWEARFKGFLDSINPRVTPEDEG